MKRLIGLSIALAMASVTFAGQAPANGSTNQTAPHTAKVKKAKHHRSKKHGASTPAATTPSK